MIQDTMLAPLVAHPSPRLPFTMQANENDDDDGYYLHSNDLCNTSGSSSRGSTPDISSVESSVRQTLALSHPAVTKVQLLRGHLHSIYRLEVADGTAFIVKCEPSRHSPILRHEHRALEDEARILYFLGSETSIKVAVILRHEAQRSPLGTPFLLTTHLPGTPLSTLAASLSPHHRHRVDRSLGCHVRALASLTTSSFGRPSLVEAGRGQRSWLDTFSWLLEAILRDAEDALVSLPYDSIRHHMAKHGHVLSLVPRPQLVRLDAGDESKILVDPNTLEITGILGWTNVVWGDPLAADVFAYGPSEQLMEGYGHSIESSIVSRVRQLLYAIYHSVTAIVVQAYRPKVNNLERQGRRRLTAALTELAKIDTG